MPCHFSYSGETGFVEQPGSPSWVRGITGEKGMTRTYRGTPAAFNSFLAAHPPGTVDATFPDMTVQTVNVREWGPAYVTVEISHTGVDPDLTASFTKDDPKIEDTPSYYASATIYVDTNAEGFRDVVVNYWRPVHIVSYTVSSASIPTEADSSVGRNRAKNGAPLRILSWTPGILNTSGTGPASIPPKKGSGETDHYEVYVFGKITGAKPLGNPKSPGHFKITETWEQLIITRGNGPLNGFDESDKVP